MDGTQAHRSTLKDRHADLDRQIEEEMRRPVPDSVKVGSLKRRKLSIKEELRELET